MQEKLDFEKITNDPTKSQDPLGHQHHFLVETPVFACSA